MSEQPSQEPTMEEILASIRRIISEDESTPEAAEEAPAEVAVATAPAPEPERPPAAVAPEPEPEPAPPPVVAAPPAPVPALVEAEDEDDDLELTQRVETHGDLDVFDAGPEPVAAPPLPAAAATLVSAQVAAVAAASFDKLSATIAMPAAGRTLEDVVREMLRPMLQQWLDENLPGIVQEAVQAEVDRISRSRVR